MTSSPLTALQTSATQTVLDQALHTMGCDNPAIYKKARAMAHVLPAMTSIQYLYGNDPVQRGLVRYHTVMTNRRVNIVPSVAIHPSSVMAPSGMKSSSFLILRHISNMMDRDASVNGGNTSGYRQAPQSRLLMHHKSRYLGLDKLQNDGRMEATREAQQGLYTHISLDA